MKWKARGPPRYGYATSYRVQRSTHTPTPTLSFSGVASLWLRINGDGVDGWPRFSSSFGVHEKTAWTRFKEFFLDGEGWKRVTKLGCRGLSGSLLAFLTSFFINLGPQPEACSPFRLSSSWGMLLFYSISRVEYSRMATGEEMQRRGR